MFIVNRQEKISNQLVKKYKFDKIIKWNPKDKLVCKGPVLKEK